MDPKRAAQAIADHFQANQAELEWVERVIRSVLPRGPDSDPTPVRTSRGFPPPHTPKPRKTHWP